MCLKLTNSNRKPIMIENRITMPINRSVHWQKWRSLILIFVLMSGLGFGQVRAQENTYSIEVKEQSLEEVFAKVQKLTGYRFFYSDDFVAAKKKISFTAKDLTIQQIVAQIKKLTKLNFKFQKDKLIVVSSKKKTPRQLKGVIRDKKGEAIIGVTIVEKGTTNGVLSRLDGSYEITVSGDDAILSFSFMGFQKQEIPVDGKASINVTLKEDVRALEEVVVSALNIKRNKNSLGYSISQVKSDEVNSAKENNPINSLSGKVSGLQIVQSATGVDGSTRVVLRGVSSLTGNNRPLFVVDGIPMNASSAGDIGHFGGRDMGDGLSSLNPEDIESMSVLKGAGAAAAYGSRGANGVILITTKKGRKRKSTGIAFSSSYTIQKPHYYPDLIEGYGQGAHGVYTMDPSGMPGKSYPWIWSWGPKIENQKIKNWLGQEATMTQQGHPFKEFYQNGFAISNTVSMEGGGESSTYRVSITDQRNEGVLPGNELNRQTVNMRGFTKLGKVGEVDGKITYVHHKAKNRPYLAEHPANTALTLLLMPRNIALSELQNNVMDANGNEQRWHTDNSIMINPYWVLENFKNQDEKQHLQTLLSTKFFLAENLNIMARSGFDYTHLSVKEHARSGAMAIANGKGMYNNGMSSAMEWNTDVLMSYSMKTNDFNFGIDLGGNIQYNNYKSINQWGSSSKVPGFYHISNYKEFKTSEHYSSKKIYSVYSLMRFGFKDYLYFDATMRNDWSSTLPLNNNSYFYHSENLSFLFSKAFGLPTNILSQGKLRGSFARVGNDTGPYQIQKFYSILQSKLNYPMAGISGQLPFYDLKPEITDSWEVGTNLAFFDNRLNLDVTYYNNVTKNQIMAVPLPASTAYDTKKINAGEISNKGFELQLNATPIDIKDGLQWQVTFNYSRNKSRVEELSKELNSERIILNKSTNMNIEARVGEEYGLIYGYDYKRDNFGNILVGKDGYAQRGDYVKMGSITPDWIGGVSNQFKYKNFTLSFLIDMSFGAELYSWGKGYRTLFGIHPITLEGREEWYSTHDPQQAHQVPLQGVEEKGYIVNGVNEQTGEVNTKPVNPMIHWFGLFNNKIIKDWVLDASNVRLREVVVGYNLPKRWLKKTPITNAHISLVGRNLFFLYNAAEGIDPESGYGSGNTGNGIEHSALPSASSYGFSIKVNF
ncbi:SusC/RagA family TonB-linked outer membrane protein [Prolixibacteraceae bacterium JC049]|nr:SusC/RagA family TonB-linked outer membrane protein [Prolixibacteraceae bacterium JC049]